MAVYVDNYRGKFGRMIMSHMMADSASELHSMAKKLGLKRKWFQDKGCPHYDVSQSKRKLALELGVTSLPIGDRREWSRVYNKIKYAVKMETWK